MFALLERNCFLIRIGKKLPTSFRNISLQFVNKVKSTTSRIFEFTRILFQFFDDIPDSINRKDEDLLHSKDESSLDNSIKLTSNSCSINNYTNTANYESTSVSYNDTKASNCKYEYPILDQLGFDFFSLQDN